MDSIVHFENERFIGRTNFYSGLLNSIVLLSIKDVEGVARMCHSGARFRRIFDKSIRQGVAVKYDFDGVTINVRVWAKFGYSAADVSYRIQESIINAISSLIEDKIKNINVWINGVVSELRRTA